MVWLRYYVFVMEQFRRWQGIISRFIKCHSDESQLGLSKKSSETDSNPSKTSSSYCSECETMRGKINAFCMSCHPLIEVPMDTRCYSSEWPTLLIRKMHKKRPIRTKYAVRWDHGVVWVHIRDIVINYLQVSKIQSIPSHPQSVIFLTRVLKFQWCTGLIWFWL